MLNKQEEKISKSNKSRSPQFISRWLHTYLSMVSFIIVLFFAVTGLTLNHAEWFDGKEKIEKIKGTLPLVWVNTRDTSKIQKLSIVEWFRNKNHIKGAVSDFILEDNRLNISFKGPGYSADAFVNREDGAYTLTETQLGWVAVVNDLHKGRDTGKKWAYLIDAAAIFMCLVSLTGLWMMVYLKKKRINGFILLVFGLLICYLVYFFLVP
jgi:hypothetical protein